MRSYKTSGVVHHAPRFHSRITPSVKRQSVHEPISAGCAILDPANGALLETQPSPTRAAGINRAIKWVARRTNNDEDILCVIEGAASYGTILAGTVANHGFPVAEAPRMDAKSRRGAGKTDALDAHRMARALLPLPVKNCIVPA